MEKILKGKSKTQEHADKKMFKDAPKLKE